MLNEDYFDLPTPVRFYYPKEKGYIPSNTHEMDPFTYFCQNQQPHPLHYQRQEERLVPTGTIMDDQVPLPTSWSCAVQKRSLNDFQNSHVSCFQSDVPEWQSRTSVVDTISVDDEYPFPDFYNVNHYMPPFHQNTNACFPPEFLASDFCSFHRKKAKLHDSDDPEVLQDSSAVKEEDKDRRFECDVCKRLFTTCSNLKAHERLHSGEKPHTCKQCNYASVRKSDLKKHERTHTGEKPYECTVCSRLFTQSSHLKVHERVHSGERPYLCDICGRGFKETGHLERHRRTHTGEKPHVCDICGHRCSQKSDLRIHRRVHVDTSSLTCDVCEQSFAENSLLKAHLCSPQLLPTSAPSSPSSSS